MNDLNIYTITAAIADPVRLSVMIYLIRGRATFSEIQQYLDISQSNLSNHLAVLYKSNLIKKISIGRRNSYEIASSDAAQLIELLQNMQKTAVNRQPVKNIAVARTCYDHVAGKLGVSIFNALHERNAIIYTAPAAGLTYFSEDVRLGINSEKTFRALGVDLSQINNKTRRKYIYACLDWTEKKPHLAGAVGAALFSAMIEQNWIAKNDEKRVLRITDTGKKALREIIKVDLTFVD
ncbi:MAG TPA: winged helix-turn-helix domain-containing protein [Mucilaginibacter sp.]|jgi:DNA-binding transcriptional ArsR family regulator|nr:winged helix-turn-helix domain-containing protein [Mucilaginibacter sp.]